MAPVAFILGGICGTFSALFGWVAFGLSFWGGVQLYFAVGFAVATLLIVFALMRSGASADRSASVESDGLQRA